MCRSSTPRLLGRPGTLVAVCLAAVTAAAAQPAARDLAAGAEWRQIGNTAVELSLASLATGAVDRVWYSESGDELFALARSGKVFLTRDFETWAETAPGEFEPPPERPPDAWPGLRLPEPGAKLSVAPGAAGTVYALGRAVYRSEDGGLNWTNLTDYQRRSILGGGLTDLAVSPRNEREIVVAGRYGVWRSLDGGLSWSGLNESLPNLPVRRLVALPERGRGTRVLLDQIGEAEWPPGERSAWRPVADDGLAEEVRLRRDLSAALGAPILAVAAAGDYVYAGSGEQGRLWASSDGGRSWRPFTVAGGGPVERIFVLPGEPRVALAALGASPGPGPGAHVVRTTNGGIFWDDLTANLPDAPAHGITADAATGSVYVATGAGAFFTVADLRSAGPATEWVRLGASFGGEPVRDVRLDVEGNQLYLAVEGRGVFATTAPHRRLVPAVVSAADLRARGAAPGVLLSVLGAKVNSAWAGQRQVPILAAGDRESQIQVPFEVSGSSLMLAFSTAGAGAALRRFSVGLPLADSAPAIFVDRDGTPMILDAASGILLDAMRPAHSGSRIQILATGLGRVSPEWPTGLPAPLEHPPKVVAPVRVFLDRMPLAAARATLAPGYVGFYLVEVDLPEIVNYGPAELYLEVGGRASNRTRLYLEP